MDANGNPLLGFNSVQHLRDGMDRQHLAHGDRMNPDIVLSHPVEEPVGNRAQALAPAGSVLAMPQHLQQPPRRAENQR